MQTDHWGRMPALYWVIALCLVSAHSLADAPHEARARSIFSELMEINTAPSGGPGQTRVAADRMAALLLAAGFPASDVQVIGPDKSLGNLVARYRSPAPAHRPLLMMAHIDVVEALPSDWSVPPFTFLERDGYFYGRGSTDNKAGAAMLVANFIRLREEGFEPDRDLIIVLTADEESTGASIQWLLNQRRPLIDAEFALNTDGGSVLMQHDEPRAFMLQTSEKIYASFQLQATNAGGHSSLPRPDNAIYTLATAVQAIAAYHFPVDLNETTRAFFGRWEALAEADDKPLLRALGKGKISNRMEQELRQSFHYNALARTTCVATELAGGHAENALPQSATATINCRILPQSSVEDVEAQLKKLVAPTGVAVTTLYEPQASPPSPLTPGLVAAVTDVAREFWSGIDVIPQMSTGATDGMFVRNAGIPVYGVSAIAENADEDRAHGRDERIRSTSFYAATEYWYRLTKKLAGGSGEVTAGNASADIVLRNGGIYTLNPTQAWAQAVAIRNGAIAAVGSNDDVSPWIGEATRVVDLTGKMLLPGFHDAHVHPISAGHTMLGCALNEQTSIDALLARLQHCAETSDDEWVVGLDFDLGLFAGGNPDKALLDAILPNRPVWLVAADGHNAWANSRALELAGISATTPNPPQGIIERYPATGEASGTLRETAQTLVSALLPPPSLDDNVAALRAALEAMRAVGITSFIDASVGEDEWQAYRTLDQRGTLNARVTTSLTYGTFSDYSLADFDGVLARRADYESPMLKTGAVKLFVDGVLEGQTAALVEPYLGPRQHRGTLNFEQQQLNDAVARFDAMGLQVHLHAIGDGAVRTGLDALQSARERNGITDNRHHMAHLQLVHADDLSRFAALNVSANFQSLWAYPDAYIMQINLPDIGAGRVNRMYPVGSIFRAGGRIVGGSDWSVSSVNPLDAIETAVRRQDPSGTVDGVLNAAEAMDLAAMLAAYTRNTAWLMHQDALTGSIETGKRADLVLLDRNLFEVPPEQINEARVVLTLFDGTVVYERDDG